MITREADYAIRAMLFLSASGNGVHPVSTEVLAQEMEIPYRFLRRIVSRLVRAGLVRTTRGRGGGLIANREAAEITILDVLKAIDPRSLRLSACVEDDSVCSRTQRCAVRREVAKVQQDMTNRLGSIRFDALADCAAH
jgi:Rrf2 family transcriptional regulator, iron-sulfur cluster assembly transcription factor